MLSCQMNLLNQFSGVQLNYSIYNLFVFMAQDGQKYASKDEKLFLCRSLPLSSIFQLQYKNRVMQTQDPKEQKSILTNSQQDLVALLVATFRGRSQSQTRRAQLILQQSFIDPNFPNRIAQIIYQSAIDKQIRKAGANILKNLAYQIGQKEGDKSAFIQILYDLIMIKGLETKIKQQLGGAMEHIFNRDQKGIYKSIVKEKVLQILVSQDGENTFDSCISILNAYFNSLLTEPEEMFEFFHEILQPICSQALQIYQHVSKMSLNEWLTKDKQILPQITSFFQFLESSLQKMSDQQDYFIEQTLSIKQNPFLINLLENYLLLFHDHQSIISNSYPIINPVKNTIMNCIWYLYDTGNCPQKMFKIIFLTTLVQCKQIVNQIQHQNILVNCLNILQAHMSRGQYTSLYQYHQMEFVFALFMYSSTNEEQRDLMSTQPTKFAQIAQDYTEGAPRSTYLKIRAGNMLKIFAQKLDEALRNILQILMVIMSGSLSPQDQDSILMQNVKEQFSRFNFYGLNDEQKLQTSFMVLAALSPLITRRDDMNKVIYAFFLTQFESLNRINSQLVILRLIRVISYFPSALYFLYIESQMNRGGIFIIQGIKSLERILRTNRFDELFRFLSTIFIKLMGVLRIQDPVMQLIIINYYEKMLKANSQLYTACRLKIKQSFFINAINNNQHGTLICFNLIYSLLRKEQDLSQIDAIEKDFYQISHYLQKQEQQLIYSKYQQKLIEIYQVIIQKKPSITPQVQSFAINSLKHISSHERGSQIFKFYNIYLIKLDGAIFKLDGYFKIIWNEVKRRFLNYDQDKEVFNSLPYFFFLMSEIISNHGQIIMAQEDFKSLIQMTEKLPNTQKQYPLIVFLTHLYMQPKLTVTFLKKYNIYEAFVDGLTGIDFDGMIMKKIFNLALIMLLEIQQDANLTKKILIKCISHLKDVIQKIRIKLQRENHIQIKPRKFGQQRSMVFSKNEQSMQQQDKNDNQLINLFVNFKHPLQTLSQFDQFKIKIWMNDSIISDLDEYTKTILRNIMETEMVDKAKMRVIKKVKRAF